MGKCILCSDFIPPWLMDEETSKCLFCEVHMGTSNDSDTLSYNNETYVKKDVKDEYIIYMKKLMERNKDEIIKKLAKGKLAEK